MGLGAEVASPDILNRPPHNLKIGIFTPEVLIDILVYGLFGASLNISVFVLIVFAFGDGNLGIDSNESLGNGSELVFRARAASFATMTWICLFLAFEVMDMRRSFFRMKPKSQ